MIDWDSIEYDEAWGQKLERGFEDYTDALGESVDSDEEQDTVTGIPFCGCDVCWRRETIAWVTLAVVDGMLSGELKVTK